MVEMNERHPIKVSGSKSDVCFLIVGAALAGDLPGLGLSMIRGPYAGRQLGQALDLGFTWSTGLEDHVRGSVLNCWLADLHVSGRLAETPRCSPSCAFQSGKQGARAPFSRPESPMLIARGRSPLFVATGGVCREGTAVRGILAC